MKKILAAICMVVALSACASIDGTHYLQSKPKLDLKEYFTGPIQAWGMVQDRKKNVVRRFDIDMMGAWQGNQGTLTENFTYYDGKKQRRVWHIAKLPDGTYEGRADDVEGKAVAIPYGGAANWNYLIDLPVDDKTIRLRFDDWMWLMNDGVLVNRTYMKKFGITVGELTIFMKKK